MAITPKFLLCVDRQKNELYILHRLYPACLIQVIQETPIRFVIQDLYDKEDIERTISLNNENMDVEEEKNLFESNDDVESKDDKIKRLEDNCICLFEMVKKINRKLRNIELKYSDEIEISISGEPNKEIVTEHNKDSFYSQNNAEVDSAFEKDYALTMENLKKGFMTSSFFGHMGPVDTILINKSIINYSSYTLRKYLKLKMILLYITYITNNLI